MGRKLIVAALLGLSLGATGVASAQTKDPSPPTWEGLTWNAFISRCGSFGGKAFYNSMSGDLTCVLPNGSKITCSRGSNGTATNCRAGLSLQGATSQPSRTIDRPQLLAG